jgi:hypothetical protein
VAAAGQAIGDGEQAQAEPFGFPPTGSLQASAAISHQIWFCAKPLSGRFRGLVSFSLAASDPLT